MPRRTLTPRLSRIVVNWTLPVLVCELLRLRSELRLNVPSAAVRRSSALSKLASASVPCLLNWTLTGSGSQVHATVEAFGLALVGIIAVAAVAALPHTLYLARDAHRMQRAVDALPDPNGRRTVARAHVRAARVRVVLAALVGVKAMLLGIIIGRANDLSPPVLAFLILFAATKVVLAVDSWQMARDRRAIFHDAQQRDG